MVLDLALLLYQQRCRGVSDPCTRVSSLATKRFLSSPFLGFGFGSEDDQLENLFPLEYGFCMLCGMKIPTSLVHFLSCVSILADFMNSLTPPRMGNFLQYFPPIVIARTTLLPGMLSHVMDMADCSSSWYVLMPRAL